MISSTINRPRLLWTLTYFFLLLLGIQVAINQPPFFSPDEGAHYLRAYEVRKLHLLNYRGHVGVDIPCAEYQIVTQKYFPIASPQEIGNRDVGSNDCFVNTKNSAGSYAYTSYIPSALGLYLGELFGMRVEDRLSFARTISFFVFFSILFFGIQLLEKGKILVFVASLTPGVLWAMAAVSADGASISSCWLYFCLVMRLLQQQVRVDWRSYSFLVFAALFVGMGKGAYSPMCLVALSLWRQIDIKNRAVRAIALCGPAVVAILAFATIAKSSDPSLVYLGNGANPPTQIHYALSNPLLFLKSVCRVFIQIPLMGVVAQYYSIPVEVNKNYLPVFECVWFLILLGTDMGLRIKDRLIFLSLFIISFVVVCLALYLVYSPPMSSVIYGVQDRYIYPIVPLLLSGIAFDASRINWVRVLQWKYYIVLVPLLYLSWACICR